MESLSEPLHLTAAAVNWLITQVDKEFGENSFVKATFTNPDRCRILVERVLSGLDSGSAVPDLPPGYGAQGERKLRRQNAVHTIVNAGLLREGTALTFKSRVAREREAVDGWLSEDPKHGQATWVNHRSRPLLWTYDGHRYSPTGIGTRIWMLANWTGRPVAVQGTLQWYVEGEGSLADIAQSIENDYGAEPIDVVPNP